ncbi:MAG: choloylglycine hydrolase [Oscillospiraceae bacterium]|nr:choloylglycine hydrolase [Oscillospiraceae bacterium]
MCTSLSMNSGGFCFGRNMDIEFKFNADIVIIPRQYPLNFRKAGELSTHYAITGTAMIAEGYPLYADAMNEKGLCMAGLSFPDSRISERIDNSIVISPFELIPWVLSQCADISEARALLQRTSLAAIPFSENIPLTPLHWHIADKNGALVLESTADGVRIYDDPIGVLTNSPPFPFHLTNFRQYLHIRPDYPDNITFGKATLSPFGRGFGTIGLPGDFSPASRYVRAAYLKLNSPEASSENKLITQTLHILRNVAMPLGSVRTADGRHELTDYSCCMSGGVYYFCRYNDSSLRAVDMSHERLDGDTLIVYTKVSDFSPKRLN